MTEASDREYRLLLAAWKSLRKEWAAGSDRTSIQNVKSALLEQMRENFKSRSEFGWDNYTEVVKDETTRKALASAKDNFDDDLKALSGAGLLEVVGDQVNSPVDFAKVCSSLLSSSLSQAEAENAAVSAAPKVKPQDLLTALVSLGELRAEGGVYSPVLAPAEDVALDQVLTSIERKDALQIKFGLYDSSMQGDDILSDPPLAGDPLLLRTEYCLRKLMDEGFLLPLATPPDIRQWTFRSRIAEITRLVSKLRQRILKTQTYQETRSLARGVKLEVLDRLQPTRSLSTRATLKDLLDEALEEPKWRGSAADLQRAFGLTADALERLDFALLSNFQARSFEGVFGDLIAEKDDSTGTVITAGTGTGKTLAYLGPLLFFATFTKSLKKVKGTKSISIYPRIKLAENQIDSFVRALFEINSKLTGEELPLTIGIDYTGTPYSRDAFAQLPSEGELRDPGGTRRLWKHNTTLDAYECPYAKCPKCGSSLVLERSSDFSQRAPLECTNSTCGTKVGFVLYSKADIADDPPDILIITTESLNDRLFNSQHQKLFGTEDYLGPRLVVVDEIHLHTALKGSQVAYVLRRLIQRITWGNIRFERRAQPLVLGLSATIAQPREFFSELTGIPEYRVRHERPLRSELEKSGVDYYLFVKPETRDEAAPLSCLIQTCMCVLHNMKQPQGFPGRNAKALGFVDSLDLVKRWQHDFDDAEDRRHRKQLFRMRDPAEIRRLPSLQAFFGGRATCTCDTTIDPNCIFFREGECWWFMTRRDSQQNGLRISYKTSGEGGVPDNYDLVVTTSAMEVGYDDPEISCVIQYQSPMNVASFAQRKGRGGRRLLDRPIAIAVLSPYLTRDVYNYRNHHLLTEPTFEKLPLNVDNKLVKDIHALYSVLDYLAFEGRSHPSSFPTAIAQNDSWKFDRLLERNGYASYVAHVVGEGEEIQKGLAGRIRTLQSKLTSTPQSPRNLLPEFLPSRLFASVNLPSVDVYEFNVHDPPRAGHPADETWAKSWKVRPGCSQAPNTPAGFLEIVEKGYCPRPQTCGLAHRCRAHMLGSDVDINLAISETAIANVTFRWGRDAYWIPPMDSLNDDKLAVRQMKIENNWLATGSGSFRVNPNLVPASLLPIAPRLHGGTQRDFYVERPEVIREAVFLRYPQEESHWVYCLGHGKLYAGLVAYQQDHAGAVAVAHQPLPVTKKSTSYPFGFCDIQFRTETLPKEGYVKRVQLGDFERGRMLSLFDRIFNEVYFGNGSTGVYLDVSKVSIGSTCSIALRDGTYVEGVYGFGKGDQDVGLGYQMTTDGCKFFVGNDLIRIEELSKETTLFSAIKHNLFKFDVLSESKKPGGQGLFTVTPFLDAFLLWLDELGGYARARKFVDDGCASAKERDAFNRIVARFFMLGDRTKSNITSLLVSQPFMKKVLESYESLVLGRDPEKLKAYVEDVLVHSLKHALKSSFTILGGFESERDLGGWAYLNYDFPRIGEKQIYLFENGMYGTGSMLSTFSRFRQNPRTLWSTLENYSTKCPTGDDEDFLRGVLASGEEKIGWIRVTTEKLRKSRSEKGRRAALSEFLAGFRSRFGTELGEEQVRSLYRVFSDPYVANEERIENWELYRELSRRYDSLRSRSGRDPSTFEVQEDVFRQITNSTPEPKLENWFKLYKIMKGGTDSPYNLRVGQIRSAIAQMADLQAYLGACSATDLERLAGIPPEDQAADVISKLRLDAASDDDRERARDVVDTLFELFEGASLHAVFKQISQAGSVDAATESRVRDLLTRKQLKEEVDKRLLNTCVDSCPSCLETPCEIDTVLRSRLLLSRRLLSKVVQASKASLVLKVDGLKEEEFYEKVKAQLASRFEAYLHYSAEQSPLIGRVVGRLIGDHITTGSKEFTVEVNYSGARPALESGSAEFESVIVCREA